jgi:hypothetical protein
MLLNGLFCVWKNNHTLRYGQFLIVGHKVTLMQSLWKVLSIIYNSVKGL